MKAEHLNNEEKDLLERRKEMSKDVWIKNVMRIYPERFKEETEALWQKLFEMEVMEQVTNSIEKEL